MVERGIGVAGALDRGVLSELAPHVERLGYRTFWVNDTPVGDGLEALARVAERTRQIGLAVGVIALDRRPPDEIARRIRELALPAERLTVGVGAGATRQGLALVREGVAGLRALLDPSVTIVVGALGPRMCQLAGEEADGVLLNWLTPDWAMRSAALVRDAAVEAGREAPKTMGYVRVVLGDEALPRLAEEAGRYQRIPSYAKHFERMGTDALGTTAFGADAAALQRSLAPFDAAVDETVVRGITSADSLDAYLALAEACSPPVEG